VSGGETFLLVTLKDGYVPIGCFRQERFYSMNVGKRNWCGKFLMDVSVWNSYSAMKKKRSYWLAGKMGYVTIGCFRHEGFYSVNFGKRNYCEKFLMDVSVLNSYSAMKKKLSYWLAGKMRGVPIG
jgi:hypothetical protein